MQLHWCLMPPFSLSWVHGQLLQLVQSGHDLLVSLELEFIRHPLWGDLPGVSTPEVAEDGQDKRLLDLSALEPSAKEFLAVPLRHERP